MNFGEQGQLMILLRLFLCGRCLGKTLVSLLAGFDRASVSRSCNAFDSHHAHLTSTRTVLAQQFLVGVARPARHRRDVDASSLLRGILRLVEDRVDSVRFVLSTLLSWDILHLLRRVMRVVLHEQHL